MQMMPLKSLVKGKDLCGGRGVSVTTRDRRGSSVAHTELFNVDYGDHWASNSTLSRSGTLFMCNLYDLASRLIHSKQAYLQ